MCLSSGLYLSLHSPEYIYGHILSLVSVDCRLLGVALSVQCLSMRPPISPSEVGYHSRFGLSPVSPAVA